MKNLRGGAVLSRRDILAGVGIAEVSALTRQIATVFASPSPWSTLVNFSVPAGACDCHTHIVADPLRFPFAASRTYTPEPASVAEMGSLHRALHTDRVVIVQPSFYGKDNSCTLDAIKQIGPGARGIAAISDTSSNADLDELHRGGIRGIRISITSMGRDPAVLRQQLKTAVDRIKGRDWHVELITTELWQIEAIKDEVMVSPVPVSIDLGSQAALGLHQPGFDTLLSLIHAGNAYVNAAGPYGAAKQEPEYPDAGPAIKALIAANPRRITWGTNWPHAGHIITQQAQVDDGRDFNRFAAWTSGASQLKLILVENPARLYGF
jgi:predicted TIM-barrel fold metal-dependent hydrolase